MSLFLSESSVNKEQRFYLYFIHAETNKSSEEESGAEMHQHSPEVGSKFRSIQELIFLS